MREGALRLDLWDDRRRVLVRRVACVQRVGDGLHLLGREDAPGHPGGGSLGDDEAALALGDAVHEAVEDEGGEVEHLVLLEVRGGCHDRLGELGFEVGKGDVYVFEIADIDVCGDVAIVPDVGG